MSGWDLAAAEAELERRENEPRRQVPLGQWIREQIREHQKLRELSQPFAEGMAGGPIGFGQRDWAAAGAKAFEPGPQQEILQQEIARTGLREEQAQQKRWDEAGGLGRFGQTLGEGGRLLGRGLRQGSEAVGEASMLDSVFSPDAPLELGMTEEEHRARIKLKQAAEAARPVTDENDSWAVRSIKQGLVMAPDQALGIASYGAGGPAGMVAYWTARMYPEARDEMIEHGVSPDAASQLAVLVSTAMAGVEMINVDPTGLTAGMKRGVAQGAWHAAMQTAVDLGIRYGKEVSEEGIQEFIQAFSADVISGKMDISEAQQRSITAMIESAGPLMFMMGPGGSLRTIRDGVAGSQTKSLTEAMEAQAEMDEHGPMFHRETIKEIEADLAQETVSRRAAKVHGLAPAVVRGNAAQRRMALQEKLRQIRESVQNIYLRDELSSLAAQEDLSKRPMPYPGESEGDQLMEPELGIPTAEVVEDPPGKGYTEDIPSSPIPVETPFAGKGYRQDIEGPPPPGTLPGGTKGYTEDIEGPPPARTLAPTAVGVALGDHVTKMREHLEAEQKEAEDYYQEQMRKSGLIEDPEYVEEGEKPTVTVADRLMGLKGMIGASEVVSHSPTHASVIWANRLTGENRIDVRLTTQDTLDRLAVENPEAWAASKVHEDDKPAAAIVDGEIFMSQDAKGSALAHDLIHALADANMITEEELALFVNEEGLTKRFQRVLETGKSELNLFRRIGNLIRGLGGGAEWKQTAFLKKLADGRVAERMPQGPPKENKAIRFASQVGTDLSDATWEKIRLADRPRSWREWAHGLVAVGGHLPEVAQRAKLIAEQRRKAAEYAFGRIITSYHKEVGDKMNKEMWEGLTGQTPIETLPKKLQPVVAAMRGVLDNNQRRLAELYGLNALTAKIFRDNEGRYVHRYYRRWDPFHTYKPKKKHADAYNAWLIENTDMTAAQRRDHIVLMTEAKNEGGFWGFVNDKATGKAVQDIFKRRKEIPFELRQLWQEVQDPWEVFIATAVKQAQALQKAEFRNMVYRWGKDNFLFEKMNLETDPAHSKPIESAYPWGVDPLEGLYTTPLIKQALEDIQHPMSRGIRAFMWLNTLLKMHATLHSFPGTHIRNWLTWEVMALADGDFGMPFRGGLLLGKVAAGQETEFDKDFIEDGIRYGVSGTSINAGEIQANIRDSLRMKPGSEGDFLAHTGHRQTGKAMQRLNWWSPYNMDRGIGGFLKRCYAAGDDIPKLRAWRYFRQQYAAAWGLSPDSHQVKQKAAEVVQATYATFELAPELAQIMRRNPLIGLFSIFPSEMVRTITNRFRLIKREMDDPALQHIALRRMFGMMSSIMVPKAAALAMSSAAGVSDEDDRAIRMTDAPWDKHGARFYLWADREKQEYARINWDYINPYAVFEAPARAFYNGETWGDKLLHSAGEFLQNWGGVEMGSQTLAELYSLYDFDSQKEIIDPNDVEWRKWQARFIHAVKEARPGYMRYGWDIYQGAVGKQTYYGRQHTLTDAGFKAMGVKIYVKNEPRSMMFAFDHLRKRATAVMGPTRNMIRNMGEEFSTRQINSRVRRDLRQFDNAARDAVRLAKAMETLGFSPKQKMLAIREGDWSKQDATLIMAGYPPRYRLPQNTTGVNTDRTTKVRKAIAEYYAKERNGQVPEVPQVPQE